MYKLSKKTHIKINLLVIFLLPNLLPVNGQKFVPIWDNITILCRTKENTLGYVVKPPVFIR